ncbi:MULTISPECIES: transglutaminase-like domain-containing protein [unclassified Paenibacillus]|uniref:transglutaminase-like domain-containing protein n=1 Tax=unclassified Paenibacillus TaxID=185978 RepID=UPI00362F06D5
MLESNHINDYLEETDEIDFSHPTIREQIELLADGSADNELAFIQSAFEYVRDEIAHSWDIQSTRITWKASDVLLWKEGICYAKSNLLAAILRGRGIPAGFCYQRLTLGDTPDTGYCVHALNAVYVSGSKKWIRLDARGNKEGINAQFSTEEERLAFPVREFFGEIDYPTIYSKPNAKTMEVLKKNTSCLNMYLNKLPTDI